MNLQLEPGSVTLVGGGPGDPDLLTVGGLKALQQADVVIHDRLAPLECLSECREDALIIPVGKIPRGKQTSQSEINQLLIEHAKSGKKVVRFKGGDNFVFGRGGEEWIACAEAGVKVQVIPGVTSAVSVPALADIPVTHRCLVQGFIAVSGHVSPKDPRSQVNWAQVAQCNLTIVVLMGLHNAAAIVSALLDAGMCAQTPAACIQDGYREGTQIEHTVLAKLPDIAAQMTPPAIMVIGSVAEPGLLPR